METNTVNRVLKRAKELNIHWPLDEFPKIVQEASNKRMPDFECIRSTWLYGASKAIRKNIRNYYLKPPAKRLIKNAKFDPPEASIMDIAYALLADAILNRIAHDSYRINIKSIDTEHDISMREIYGLDKSLRE